MTGHLGELMPRAAQRWPDEVFAVFEGEALTFAGMGAWVDATARDLRAAGVRAGDPVLVHLPNCFEVLVLQLAAWRLGAVSVPVVPIYRERELRTIVHELRPPVVVAVAALGDRHPADEFDRIIAECPDYAPARWNVGAPVSGWTRVRARPDVPVEPISSGETDPEGCALILYTSGTTAAPKGVRLSSSAIAAATAAWAGIGIGATDVAFAVAPLAHIAGLVPGGLLPLTVGCRVVITPRWDPDEAMRLIDEHGATVSCGATVFLADLVDRYEAAGPEVHRLSYFASGGAPTPPDLVRRADKVGMRAARAFGMTETAGVITLASADEPLELRAIYDGRLLPGVEVRVVDDSGNDLPPETVGSLRIRAPQLLLGYIDDQLTEAQLQDGWFDPGDLGSVTADGWLTITGRTKDIINRGGEKFSARDIEEAVLTHPAVARVAVAAVPDERFGEAVGAWVVVAAGQSWPGGKAVAAHLVDLGLAKAKIPIAWNVIDEIPVTVTGKVRKHELVDLSNTEGASRA